MSLFRHILVLFFTFATYQSAKSEDSTDRSTLPTTVDLKTEELDVAKFNFSQYYGSIQLKINMEKAECVNDKTKPSTKPLKDPEAGKKTLGLKKNPAESCADIDDSGDYFIKSNMLHQAFKVRCNVEKKTTCLLINNKINASSIDSEAIIRGNQTWLSKTKFDVQLLYNKIEGITGTNRAQISHLLSTSTSVFQKIKYYYSTVSSNDTETKAEDNKVESLKALLWNDHLVGSKLTNQLPMQFTFSRTTLCWDGNSHWMCSNIIFQDNSNNRLPVTDFYIEDVRDQKIYFDPVELCFSYD